MIKKITEEQTSDGAVMVAGAGIAGMQAAFDLAEAGFKVYLVESGSLGWQQSVKRSASQRLLLSTHEWASTEKLRRSYELFARYVMPHFRGHTTGYRDEWRAIQQANANGGFKMAGPQEPSNLALRDGSKT